MAVADILPECTGPEDGILNEAIFGWPKHWSSSKVSRVTNDLRSITNEEQWYVLVSQIDSCYFDGRGTVPTRAENQSWTDSMFPGRPPRVAEVQASTDNNIGSGSSASSSNLSAGRSSSQVGPGTGVRGAVPYYSRLNDNVLELYIEDWPAHWSESEILRVYQDHIPLRTRRSGTY